MGRPRLPDPIRHCLACGKELIRKYFKSALEDRTSFLQRKYCDQACMAVGMTGVIKVMTAQNSRRQSTRMKAQHCEHCGSTSQLHVHHQDQNPLNNEPSNLMTLCAACHMHEHWREWKVTKFPPKPCKYCSKPARHLGLCNTHYTRYRTNGDAQLVRRKVIGGNWVTVRLE